MVLELGFGGQNYILFLKICLNYGEKELQDEWINTIGDLNLFIYQIRFQTSRSMRNLYKNHVTSYYISDKRINFIYQLTLSII